MKNKLLRTLLTSSILISSVVSAAPVLANDLGTEIEEAENQAREDQQAADSLESLMNQISNEMTSTQSALNHLNSQIETNEQFLKDAMLELEKAQQEMTILEEEISLLEENIEKRSEQLEEQARKVQVNGNSTSYIDFVLMAESLTDVFARIDVVSTVVNTSNQMIDDQIRDKESVVEKTAETERKIVQQNALAEELENSSAQLESQKISQEALVAQLEMEQTTVASEREVLLARRNDALRRAEELETDQEVARLAAVQADQNRQEENLSRTASSQVGSVSEATSTNNESSNSESTTSSTNNSNNNQSNNNQSENNQAENNQPATPAPEPEPEQEPEPARPSPKPESKPKPKPKPKPNPAPAPSGNVLSIASQYIGTPYLYGGTTTNAFDCSGYTSYVFSQAGKSIPRNSAAQYARATKVSNPQPGDLVFFGSGSVSHVGIYVGGGRFIGSQTSTGVAYASLTSGYWSSRIIGYGRY